ncbi:zinc finger HIT domain-containing protein 2 [Onychostruthus taczanowskii]|uniref:zinc finger HIT domain-containing protein 2 n=1 Tax=Onychostruthus taczanowskii TaxID=356909 RepID=UPI001B8073D5|nr:zinc finger HIT domain-containing protein 2 [Onychostruthus taczanowskii]
MAAVVAAAAPCGLCSAPAAPYTCPRCHRRLCSLRCYRAHGPCAEAFYRDQVLEALRAERNSPRGPAPSGLRDLREPGDPARPTRRGLWEQLSEAERDGFRRLLSSGEAAALLPQWRPWWWRGRGRVEELGDGSGAVEEDEESGEGRPGPAPPVPASVPPLSALRAAPPSPLVRFQLPNALFGYAFALSLHGGDETLLPELADAAIAASAALRDRRPFASTAEALLSGRDDARAAGLPLSPLGDSGTLLAVAQLLEGRDSRDPGADVAAALWHLWRLLKAGARALPPPERSRFRGARRKVGFLLSWSRGATEELAQLAREAWGVHAEVATEEAAVAEIREGLEKVWGGPRPPPREGQADRAPWVVTERIEEVFGGPRPPPADKGVQGRQLIEELD